MADDALILEQSVNVALGVASNLVEIKAMKGSSEVIPFGENGAPAQSRLETFLAQFFEQAIVVPNRVAPFGVVIGEKLGCGAAPLATRFAIRPSGGLTYASPIVSREVATMLSRGES